MAPTAPAVAHAVVGIIGGMGPEATVELMRRVIARTPATDDVDHVHMLVESNPKIPSRIAHLLEGSGVDPTPELVRIARNLEAGGASLLAMPCNTAHAYAPAIRAAISIPLLDMVELAAARVLATSTGTGTRVGLLASTAVHRLRLYEDAFARLCARDGGRPPDVVAPEDQDAVMDLIRAVKRGDGGDAAQARFRALAAGLAAQSDLILVACTELSVLASDRNRPAGIPVVDALDELCERILAPSA